PSEAVGHEPQQLADLIGIVDHRIPADERVAGGWSIKRRQNPHRGRFAGTVGSDEAHHLSGIGGERATVDRLERAEEAVQVADLQRRDAAVAVAAGRLVRLQSIRPRIGPDGLPVAAGLVVVAVRVFAAHRFTSLLIVVHPLVHGRTLSSSARALKLNERAELWDSTPGPPRTRGASRHDERPRIKPVYSAHGPP